MKIPAQLALLPLGLLALGCGAIPLPAVSLPDQTITLPAGLSAASPVVYAPGLPGGTPQGLPVSQITLSGTSQAVAPVGEVLMPMTVEVYASATAPQCPSSGTTVVCASPVGERVGSFTLSSSPASFQLKGAVIDQGLKTGNLWLGLAPLSGGPLPAGTVIELRKMTASAKL